MQSVTLPTVIFVLTISKVAAVCFKVSQVYAHRFSISTSLSSECRKPSELSLATRCTRHIPPFSLALFARSYHCACPPPAIKVQGIIAVWHNRSLPFLREEAAQCKYLTVPCTEHLFPRLRRCGARGVREDGARDLTFFDIWRIVADL